jgi:replicative DNA helicase
VNDRSETILLDGRMIAEAAEKGVLGVMLLDTKAINAAAVLQPGDFGLDSNRRIFSAIRRLHDAGKAVDEITLDEELRRTKELDSVGGVGYVGSLSGGVWRTYDITSYIALIKAKAQSRFVIALCDKVSAKAVDGDDPIALLEELQSSAMAEQATVCDLRPTPICELIMPFLSHLREQRESPDTLRGISTGIPDLDEITSGWRKGELTYVGALPGRGKTAFMVQMMHAAALGGTKCGYISLEMTRQQILSRLATIFTGLHPSRFRDALTMDDAEWKHTRQQCQEQDGMGDLPIEIYDRDGLRVGEVAAVARRMVANGCKLILVDFVQKIRQEGRDARESINRISGMLAETCKALNVPFVVASQLARRDANPNRRPTMQDLRESGNLEQDAHNVLLLYRPQDSSNKDVGGQELPPGWTLQDEIIIAKQREGLVGWADVTFREGSLTFGPRAKGKAMAA